MSKGLTCFSVDGGYSVCSTLGHLEESHSPSFQVLYLSTKANQVAFEQQQQQQQNYSQVRVGALPLNGEIVAQVGRDVKAVLSSGVLDWVITGPLPEFTWIQEVKFGCKQKSRSAMI